LFQSAPRARARGDNKSNIFSPGKHQFQSAPRARARGDMMFDDMINAGIFVSIRAPRTRAGRPALQRGRDQN